MLAGVLHPQPLGTFICMQKPLVSPEMRVHIGQHLLPFVSVHLPNVYFRVKKCYALVLAAGRLVSKHYIIHVDSSCHKYCNLIAFGEMLIAAM